MNILNKIKQLSEANFNDILKLRKHLHQNPELSFCEENTQKVICDKLQEEGIDFFKSKSGYGVVALIKGKNPNKCCIGLRADMDALPIDEENNIPFKSRVKGVMHACGHDVHMSCLIGAAQILNNLKNYFDGSVKLIFQPAEEMIPGGAKKMIEEGVLENPKVDFMLAQHVSPEIKTGKVGMKEDMFMASTDEIYIDLIGKGGHAALPEKNINPIISASKLILELNDFFKNQKHDNVFSIGYFNAQGSTNIVPDIVKLKGTFRAMNEEFRDNSHKEIRNIIKKITIQENSDYKLEIKKGYPYLKNDISLTGDVFSFSKDYLGKENVLKIKKRMTAEDFAYFSLLVPSCFYRLGVGDGVFVRNLHTSTFNIDDNSLKTGMGLLCWNAISILNKF